ncbi:MAG: tRNA (adenosine(37)-N6)-dimethylallyltransferase MiaA [Pseudomonadaceae bacterium]|nr:tRNA (adenosine(37)-N6)-dimethylallyltransferase MiaA [Pseudomonadaceae bacterium]
MMPVVTLFGPTASGKSALALGLAEVLDGEIVNADSRQIYKGMPLITACPSAEDYARVPHHLYEFLSPDVRYSAGDYAKAATQVIQNVQARGKTAIVVGGTGFYLRALMEGISPIPPISDDINAAVEAEVAEDIAAAYARLQTVDAAWAARIQPTDAQRIARGLAVHGATGRALSEWQQAPASGSPFAFIKLALCPPREVLHRRIADRWQAMLEQGLLEEIRSLKEAGHAATLPALTGLGVAELYRYFEGDLSLEQAVELGIISHRQYAKRQATWLNNQYAADYTQQVPDTAAALAFVRAHPLAT